MLRSCLCMKAIFLFFLFLKVFIDLWFLFSPDVFFFKRWKDVKKTCLDRQNNTILLDVQYHPKNFLFFIMLFKNKCENVLGGGNGAGQKKC